MRGAPALWREVILILILIYTYLWHTPYAFQHKVSATTRVYILFYLPVPMHKLFLRARLHGFDGAFAMRQGYLSLQSAIDLLDRFRAKYAHYYFEKYARKIFQPPRPAASTAAAREHEASCPHDETALIWFWLMTLFYRPLAYYL